MLLCGCGLSLAAIKSSGCAFPVYSETTCYTKHPVLIPSFAGSQSLICASFMHTVTSIQSYYPVPNLTAHLKVLAVPRTWACYVCASHIPSETSSGFATSTYSYQFSIIEITFRSSHTDLFPQLKASWCLPAMKKHHTSYLPSPSELWGRPH